MNAAVSELVPVPSNCLLELFEETVDGLACDHVGGAEWHT